MKKTPCFFKQNEDLEHGFSGKKFLDGNKTKSRFNLDELGCSNLAEKWLLKNWFSFKKFRLPNSDKYNVCRIWVLILLNEKWLMLFTWKVASKSKLSHTTAASCLYIQLAILIISYSSFDELLLTAAIYKTTSSFSCFRYLAIFITLSQWARGE